MKWYDIWTWYDVLVLWYIIMLRIKRLTARVSFLTIDFAWVDSLFLVVMFVSLLSHFWFIHCFHLHMLYQLYVDLCQATCVQAHQRQPSLAVARVTCEVQSPDSIHILLCFVFVWFYYNLHFIMGIPISNTISMTFDFSVWIIVRIYFSCIVQENLHYNKDIGSMCHVLVSCTPTQSIGLYCGCALFWCWVSICVLLLVPW